MLKKRHLSTLVLQICKTRILRGIYLFIKNAEKRAGRVNIQAMRASLIVLVVHCLLSVAILPTAFGRDAARDLRKMVGYTVVMAASVEKVYESQSGDKLLKLSNGHVFKVDFLLLNPSTLTDVIVFAKTPTKELFERFKGKVPERMLYSYKLLIDNEAYDATLQ
jgi:hypothetical protein